VSPLAATVTGNAEVHGKEELRAYWTKALHARSTPLHFVFESFLWDERNHALLIVYVSADPGSQSAEMRIVPFRGR